MTATVMMKMMLTLIVVNNSFSNLKVSLLGVSFLVLVVYHSNFIYVFVVFILELFSVISFLIQLAPELVFTHTPAPFFKNAHLLFCRVFNVLYIQQRKKLMTNLNTNNTDDEDVNNAANNDDDKDKK